MRLPQDMSHEDLLGLLSDAAKNWLAHDGLWFQAVEQECGLETAMELDVQAWRAFTVIEARRIMERLDIKPGGGIPALVEALAFRMYAFVNDQAVTEVTESRCVFTMRTCRVQMARKRKKLPDFPCKVVGMVEYADFARTIDARLETRCLFCPPDGHPEHAWCSWEFVISENGQR